MEKEIDLQDVFLEVDGISKKFVMTDGSDLQIFKDVSLRIQKGEFVVLLGYSGCGKSTLLRILSALETHDDGKIYIEGHEHTKPTPDVLMIFQDFEQLFPWRTVLKNTMYPLTSTGKEPNKKKARKKAEMILEEVGLSEFKNSYPHQLSGGMKQRAAVARALVMQPKVLLMDEPFAALDAIIRTHLQNLIRQVCANYNTTIVFVTHSVEEAVLLADKIVIMSVVTHGINRIIDNTDRDIDNKEKQYQRIADIIDILDNQTRD